MFSKLVSRLTLVFCGLSTVVACKLGQSTVCVFKTLLQVNSGFVCGLSTVVACELGLSTVGVFKTRFQVNSFLFVVSQRSLLANLFC